MRMRVIAPESGAFGYVTVHVRERYVTVQAGQPHVLRIIVYSVPYHSTLMSTFRNVAGECEF